MVSKKGKANIEHLHKPKDKRLNRRNRDSQIQPFHQLHRAMDQLFEDFFSDFSAPMFGEIGSSIQEEEFFVPKMDTKVSDKNYSINIEAPGVKKQDVKIQIKDGILTISGNRKQESRHEDENYTRVESNYGSFQRSLQLPDDSDEDGIEARFEDGILNLKIPRKPEGGKDTKTIDLK